MEEIWEDLFGFNPLYVSTGVCVHLRNYVFVCVVCAVYYTQSTKCVSAYLAVCLCVLCLSKCVGFFLPLKNNLQPTISLPKARFTTFGYST